MSCPFMPFLVQILLVPTKLVLHQGREELSVKGPAKQPVDASKPPYQLHVHVHVHEEDAAEGAAEQAPLLESAAMQNHEVQS